MWYIFPFIRFEITWIGRKNTIHFLSFSEKWPQSRGYFPTTVPQRFFFKFAGFLQELVLVSVFGISFKIYLVWLGFLICAQLQEASLKPIIDCSYCFEYDIFSKACAKISISIWTLTWLRLWSIILGYTKLDVGYGADNQRTKHFNYYLQIPGARPRQKLGTI